MQRATIARVLDNEFHSPFQAGRSLKLSLFSLSTSLAPQPTRSLSSKMLARRLSRGLLFAASSKHLRSMAPRIAAFHSTPLKNDQSSSDPVTHFGFQAVKASLKATKGITS